MGVGLVHLRDNGLPVYFIIHERGRARYFRLSKCKDSDVHAGFKLVGVDDNQFGDLAIER